MQNNTAQFKIKNKSAFGVIKKQKGFTLIEVLLTLIIFASIILIYTALTGTSVASRTGRYQPIAVKIASKKIEQVRNSTWNNWPAPGSFTDSDLTKLPNGSANLAIADSNGFANLKEVIVTVSWYESASSNPKTVQLDTLVTLGGIGKI